MAITADTSDTAKIKAAFDELRKLGYWTRLAQQDGWDAVPVPALKAGVSVAFYHHSEQKVAFDADGNLKNVLHVEHLYRDAEEIERILTKHGLIAEIVADHQSRPVVQIQP